MDYPYFCTNEIHKLAWDLYKPRSIIHEEFFSLFENKFLPIITSKKFLRNHLYFKKAPQELQNNNYNIALWTQGVLEVQAAKANLVKEVFHPLVSLKTGIFISENKINLLETILPQIKTDGFEFILVIDDYEKNLRAAQKKLENYRFKYLLFRKERPERVNQETITGEFLSFLNWEDFKPAIPKNKKILLLLDVDGVCFNSTSYSTAIKELKL